VVHGHWVCVKNGCEGEEFREVIGDEVKEFLTGDAVKLVGQVKEEGCLCWDLIDALWSLDKSFNG
jgi:hypothetical protein